MYAHCRQGWLQRLLGTWVEVLLKPNQACCCDSVCVCVCLKSVCFLFSQTYRWEYDYTYLILELVCARGKAENFWAYHRRLAPTAGDWLKRKFPDQSWPESTFGPCIFRSNCLINSDKTFWLRLNQVWLVPVCPNLTHQMEFFPESVGW